MTPQNPESSSTAAQRFDSLKQTSEFTRVNGSESIPVESLPVFINLGKGALTLAVINPETDLVPDEKDAIDAQDQLRNQLNPDISTMVIDPSTYDLAQSTGYKGLRSGESVVFGRTQNDKNARFALDSPYISRENTQITKSADGKSVIITDLGSTNGTFIGRPVPPEEDITHDRSDLPAMVENIEATSDLVKGAYASSLASEKHPDTNEDSFVSDTEHNVYGVFDGVGGHEAGEVASGLAHDMVEADPGKTSFDTLDEAGDYLRSVLLRANTAILRNVPHAATTAVLAKVHEYDGQTYASIAHVGDSRAYRLRDGVLKALTVDHSGSRREGFTQEAMAQQERLADTDSISVLSPQDLAAFRHRNEIGAALGMYEPTIDISHITVEPGDSIILTSDGVHDNLTTTEMQAIMNQTSHPEYAATLTKLAQDRARDRFGSARAKMDDITAIAIAL